MATLQVESREKSSSAVARRLRREGSLPMALISKKEGTKTIVAERTSVREVLSTLTGIAIFDMKIDADAPTKVIMKDVQRDPVSREVIHLTVMEITDEDVVKVNIPVVVEGTPKAVTKRAATLMVPMNEVSIQAKVKDLPESVLVDVSKMKQNDKIVVSNLRAYEGVTFLNSPNTVLAATKQLRGMVDFVDEEDTPAEEAAAE